VLHDGFSAGVGRGPNRESSFDVVVSVLIDITIAVVSLVTMHFETQDWKELNAVG
jgi:hypothetical protein